MKSRLMCAAIAAALLWGSQSAADKMVVGWVEEASIKPENLILQAKVDTGAGNTSIDARNIDFVKRDGRRFIRFEVDGRDGNTVEIEREQVGIETVPQLSGEYQERPLVIMEICLGNECRNTVVNLTDRSRLRYPLLIGRSFMLDRVICNPSARYTRKPDR
ncbi:MAG: RimK/LysX family protein [Desulfomonilaceae bacterium]|nr:RimK/LysX family protein [Desulfomonilaceae bacterium]